MTLTDRHSTDPKIVVGYDGTDQSDDGLALAIELARVTGARLELAFAYAGDSVPLGIAAAGIGVSLRREAAAVLGTGTRQVPEDVHATALALPGSSPARALHELAEGEHARMVVLGPAEYGPVGRVLVGSVATRLLHGAPCPVAVATNGHRQNAHGFRRIGVCWNDSPKAAAALAYAVELARVADADLHLAHAVDTLDYVTAPPAIYVPDFGEIERAAEEALAQVLKEQPADVRVTSTVVVGPPAARLAEEAVRSRLDLLVSGSRGYGPVRTVLLGGVSGKLVRTAPCPVLIVPNVAAERAAPLDSAISSSAH